MSKRVRIAIVGGGIAGTSAAYYLGLSGANVTLFEREKSLVTGPPFCHLHAGGNLYPEISDEQCKTLLRQSIDFARVYPYCVDYRPTLVALPIDDPRKPETIRRRLEMLRDTYREVVETDPGAAVLGSPRSYFRAFEKSELEAFRVLATDETLEYEEKWLYAAAKTLDLRRLQFPVFLVQEYGLNLFRLAAGATMRLRRMPHIDMKLQTRVVSIERTKAKRWRIVFKNRDGSEQSLEVDYLVNAAGFRTGEIDDMIGLSCRRMVEFKAAYIARWDETKRQKFPEIIVHGERGTPRGMGQFTPYPGGYVQLHAMRKDVTLFENGLAVNPPHSCQPPLPHDLLRKIEFRWYEEEIEVRTRRAITHMAKYLPDFSEASVGAKPLYGAQQIPGEDPALRVAEAAFPLPCYARCEIVKVSSAIDMCRAIAEDIVACGLAFEAVSTERLFEDAAALRDDKTLNAAAKRIAAERDYPESMGERNCTKRCRCTH